MCATLARRRINDMLKKCSKCGQEKPSDEFYGAGWCKQCQSEYQKVRWASLSQEEREARINRIAERAKTKQAQGFCARCRARKCFRGTKHCRKCLQAKV